MQNSNRSAKSMNCHSLALDVSKTVWEPLSFFRCVSDLDCLRPFPCLQLIWQASQLFPWQHVTGTKPKEQLKADTPRYAYDCYCTISAKHIPFPNHKS